MSYTSINNYIREYSEDFYILKHHDTLFVYDYDHNLIDQFKKNIHFL